jgi:hypothetical protein
MLDLPTEGHTDLDELSKVVEDPEEDTEEKEHDTAAMSTVADRKLSIQEMIVNTLR